MEDLMEFALKRASSLGASYSEIRIEEHVGETIFFRNGKIEGVEAVKSKGFSVRVLCNGAFGFASSPRISKDDIDRAVEYAIKAAKVASKGRRDPIELSDERFYEDKIDVRPKKDPLEVPFEDKKEFLQGLFKKALEYKPVLFMIFLSTTKNEKWYMNSEGAKIEFRYPRVNVFYQSLVMEPNKWSEMGHNAYGGTRGWEIVEDMKIEEKILDEVKGLRAVVDEGKEPPKGEVDVIASPHIVGIFVHESCGHPYEADRILGREAAQAGESFVTPDMLGKRIGSEVVNVVDDPTIPGSSGYYEYDDEGVKARKRYLIKGGIINEFLLNREYAAKLGGHSNGAARASAYDREPIVRMANTYLEAGDYTFEEMAEDVKLGIYMVKFTEWNIDDRRYHQRYVGRESYLIENGEIKGPVRRPVLEITTPELWSSIDAVGKEMEFYSANCGKGDPMQGIPVWLGGAPARIRKIRVR